MVKISISRIAAISSLLFVTACAGQQSRLSTENRASLADGPRVYAVQHKPMTIFTYDSTGYAVGRAVFGLFAAISQVGEGMSLQKEFELEDPVVRVRNKLVAALKERLKVKEVSIVATAPENDQIPALLAAYPGAVVLDIRTMKWGVDNEHAIYHARARLLRSSRDRDIIWQATCKFTTDKDKPAPSWDELKANGGILLKAKVLDAADGCADELVEWLTSQERT